MRPTSTNVGANIPAFLSKLWKMVNDPETDHLICWSPGGHSFIIQNEAQFWYTLLPIYYKHNNMSSFIRQLNMYGFHKVSSENGGMDCDKDEIKFYHPFFQQDQPNLLRHIKRKIASSKTSTTTAGGEENKVNNVDQISKVLVDVKQLRGRQESVDSQLAAMKQENAALWRELALLRQKHMKQQQIVNKLIHFLVTIVQPSRSGLGGLGVKRRYPLMINDSKFSKVPKTDVSSDGPTIHELDSETALNDTLLNEVVGNDPAKTDNQVIIDSPPSNPLIESENVLLNIPIEQSDNLAEDQINPDILLVNDPDLEVSELITPDNPNVANLLANSEIQADADDVDDPLEEADLSQVMSDKEIMQVAEQMYDSKMSASKEGEIVAEEPIFEEAKSPHIINPNMKDAMISNLASGSEDNGTAKVTEETKNSMTVATRAVPDLTKLNPANSYYSDDLDNHLEATQGELDTIKDMLFEGYSLDANALLGLFNPDEDFPLDIPPLTDPEESNQNRNDNYDPMMSGSELTTYVNQPFVLDFENLFEDSSEATAGNTETINDVTVPDMSGDQINTPIVVKKEPTYPIVKHSSK